ncbi:MAG: bacteriohemerythrin [Pseudomonadota bacterium]|nr:bacteriohemerythrin [Pseudomonadota bacterium]
MSYLKWSSDLETGIEVIDNQHRRIVEYINELHDAIEHHSREEVGIVLEELVEYTLSHFAFEEDLQEQSGYPFFHAHKKVHDLFKRKIGDFQQRFELGEEVARPLITLLRTWLVNHIKRDDADYVETVKIAMTMPSKVPRKGFFGRLFG